MPAIPAIAMTGTQDQSTTPMHAAHPGDQARRDDAAQGSRHADAAVGADRTTAEVPQ